MIAVLREIRDERVKIKNCGKKFQLKIIILVSGTYHHNLSSLIFNLIFSEMEVDYMTYAEALYDERRMGISEGRAEGVAIGRAEGEAKEKHNFVVEMLQEKEPVAKIMKFTKMSFAQIQEIAKSIGVAVVM